MVRAMATHMANIFILLAKLKYFYLYKTHKVEKLAPENVKKRKSAKKRVTVWRFREKALPLQPIC